MENASKALLIAAAILIAIILGTFALLIFNSTSDIAGGATETSGKIIEAGNKASDSATSAIQGLNYWIK